MKGVGVFVLMRGYWRNSYFVGFSGNAQQRRTARRRWNALGRVWVEHGRLKMVFYR